MFERLKRLFKKKDIVKEAIKAIEKSGGFIGVIPTQKKEYSEVYERFLKEKNEITAEEAKKILDKECDTVLEVKTLLDDKEKEKQRLDELLKKVKSRSHAKYESENDDKYYAFLTLDSEDANKLFPREKTYWEKTYYGGPSVQDLGNYKPVADPYMPNEGEMPLFGLTKYRNYPMLGCSKGVTTISILSEMRKPILSVEDLNNRITMINDLIKDGINRGVLELEEPTKKDIETGPLTSRSLRSQGFRGRINKDANEDLYRRLDALELAIDDYKNELEHNRKIKRNRKNA